MEHLSKEAESCGIALEQVKNVWRERDILQKQYHEQSCTLADREDEIKRLLTLIKQMSIDADTREVRHLASCIISYSCNFNVESINNRKQIFLENVSTTSHFTLSF